MKEYTFEEMKERFGVGFKNGVLSIDEVFIDLCYKGEDSVFYKTEQEAKDAYKQIWKSRYNSQVKNLKEIVEAYESLPLHKRVVSFLFKGAWKKNRLVAGRMECFANELKSSLNSVENYKVNCLSRENYKLTLPDLNVGDVVYVSVTSQNHLPVGVHVGKVAEIEYHLAYWGENVLTYNASLQMQSGERLTLKLKDNESNELTTGFTYHKVHLDKESAVQRIKANIEAQLMALEQQIIDIDVKEVM